MTRDARGRLNLQRQQAPRAAAYSATIVRTKHGIPHIRAKSFGDLGFGLRLGREDGVGVVLALGQFFLVFRLRLRQLRGVDPARGDARLPGVAGNLSDENLVDGFTIRGIGPGLNTVTLDGSPLTSQGALNRATNMNNLTGSMFDQMELTKGHTPDKGADSLGGTVNLKSRSTLSMKEKRRMTI